MAHQKLSVIDTQSIQEFMKRTQNNLPISEPLLEEYSLQSVHSLKKTKNGEISPIRQYKDAEGYEYSWGSILERRTNEYVIWDYCCTNLLTHYLKTGQRLADLQRDVFPEIEKIISCTAKDIVDVLSIKSGWLFYPASPVGAFSQIIHFTDEKQAREWTVEHLLVHELPKILSRLQGNEKKEGL